jgi:hypothetical protein
LIKVDPFGIDFGEVKNVKVYKQTDGQWRTGNQKNSLELSTQVSKKLLLDQVSDSTQ